MSKLRVSLDSRTGVTNSMKPAGSTHSTQPAGSLRGSP